MGSHMRRECDLGAPPPLNHHKRTAGELLEDSWSLRVTHSEEPATMAHIHMLEDRRPVVTTQPQQSACCCVRRYVTWRIQLAMVTKSMLGFVGTFFECRSMEPQTKMPFDQCMPAL